MNEKTHSGVAVDVRVGEELTLDLAALGLPAVRVFVERKDGQRARLRVVADPRIIVRRPPPNRIPAKAG